MAYNIDLTQIPIDQFKKELKSIDLLPSWVILLDSIDVHFKNITDHNIRNLAELRSAINSEKRRREFSAKSNVPFEYLTILRRVINGYVRRPNRIADFPEMAPEVVSKLEKLGILNTLQLFDYIRSKGSRHKLSKTGKITDVDVLRLAKLTDLSRIQWANHTFAHVLLEAGYETAADVARADPQDLMEKVKRLNEERKLFPAHIGLRDMKRLVEAAKRVTPDIEW